MYNEIIQTHAKTQKQTHLIVTTTPNISSYCQRSPGKKVSPIHIIKNAKTALSIKTFHISYFKEFSLNASKK